MRGHLRRLVVLLPVLLAGSAPMPGLVSDVLQLLDAERASSATQTWAEEQVRPRVCSEFISALPSPEASAADGNRWVLLADIERELVWVVLRRGLDDNHFYRGPARLNREGRLVPVPSASLPPCKPSDAA